MLNPPIPRLMAALISLAGLERRIQRAVADLHDGVSAHPEAQNILARLDVMACKHLDALCQRMQVAPPGHPDSVNDSAPDHNEFAEQHPASHALGVMYTLVQEAVIGYSTIQPIALRAQDSWVMADEGTTGHIARQHTQEYLAVAGQITALLHDVVLWELESGGSVCRCTCPSCSIGICVGAISSRSLLRDAWIAASPPVAENGIALMPPRPGSPAAAAGFLRGDVIVAVDGENIDSLPLLQRMIRDHDDGDWLEFTVRRKTGEVKVAVVHRREGVDVNEDECVLPAGQEFYLGQARDVKRRLRRRAEADPSDGSALASLSARELQVLRLVAQGATNPIIADELEISRATVARHVASILAKTGLANRTEAATLASQNGLLTNA